MHKSLQTMSRTAALLLPLGLAPTLTSQAKISFENQVLPILEKSCMNCHKAVTAMSRRRMELAARDIEQEAFEAYLQRLREAKDKAEFDQFMDERAKRSGSDDATVEA